MRIRIGNADGDFNAAGREVRVTMSDGTIYILNEEMPNTDVGKPELSIRSWTGSLVVMPQAGNVIRIGQ